MNFEDKEIESLDVYDVGQLAYLLVNKLCGNDFIKFKRKEGKTELIDFEVDEELVQKFLNEVASDGINDCKFNELLLLLNQHRISADFFHLFFGDGKIEMEGLRTGIIKFRGFAMLRFGNFRFAYKTLNQKNRKEIERILQPFIISPDALKEKFTDRIDSTIKIAKIPKEKTWYNGYISKKIYENEAKYLNKLSEDKKKDTNSDLRKLKERYVEMGIDIKSVEKKSLKNTDIYLTWDYIDVYVATSMRDKWDFEDVSEFIDALFSFSNSAKFDITNLGLRYFDPTQSQCANRVDKGLVEGLMLKRALCTIYMAQEGDTLGKDSELASTLAQGKPVIAYIPVIDTAKHTEKIKKRPINYFEHRFYDLRASRIFEDPRCEEELIKLDPEYEKTIFLDFLPELNKYRSEQPFTLWKEEENKYKESLSKNFDKICKLLSIAEKHNFEKRAYTLKFIHPLSMQVHLESGVANGVLVVRNVKDCAELLYKILTNLADFEIKHKTHDDYSFYSLEEKISRCPFRVVTGYKKLTNSYWNLYLSKDLKE